MENEISGSLKACDIFGLIFFYGMCYFWRENSSDLCKLIVCGSQTLRSEYSTNTDFPKKGIPSPLSTSINITCMVVSNPLLQDIRQLLDMLNCTK